MRPTQTQKGIVVCVLLTVGIITTGLAQPAFPPPDTNAPPVTSTNPAPEAIIGLPVPVPISLGTEFVLLNTLPTTPNPTNRFPAWATIRSGGIIVDTNGDIVDTNATPTEWDGFPAGGAAGVILANITNATAITRGEFYVLITNGTGQLSNTRFAVKVMRGTNDFLTLFDNELAAAEYTTNSTNVSLTVVTGTASTNLYKLAVPFPPCVCIPGRLVSIRTEPVDFELPFVQMHWLAGTGTNETYTTDTYGNLTLQTNCPAMKLWARQLGKVGLGAQISYTPGALQLFTLPGMVLTSKPYLNSAPVDLLRPDEQGYGVVDISQTNTGFFSVRLGTLADDIDPVIP